MKIFLTTPSLRSPHGGIRVILEWANRLSKWHKVYLYCEKVDRCDWFKIDGAVTITHKLEVMAQCDCLIITSPHNAHLQFKEYAPAKIYMFMQMLEHMFNDNPEWHERCKMFYQSQYPMFSISVWNMEALRNDYGRIGEMHYIGNGVNLDHFPISTNPKSGKIVLIEGWEGYNGAKDTDKIAPKAAKRLKANGYKIWAYGLTPFKTMTDVIDRQFIKPNLQQLNALYEEATILLKASKYDARACAPMEAMTKGTVTARAIILGDDDLVDGQTCLRSGYDEDQLYDNAIRLLTDNELRRSIAGACYDYAENYTWDYWMERINKILLA